MSGETLRLGEVPHLLNKTCLADTRFAPDIDDVTASPAKTSVHDALELVELGLPPDKQTAACGRGLARTAAQAPDAHGRIKSLQLFLTKRITRATTGKRAVNAIGYQGLPWAGSSDEPSGEIYRIAENRVVVHVGATHGAGDDLPVSNANMRQQRARRGFAELSQR